MRRNFDVEFKTMIVELIQSGKSVKEVSTEYNLSDSMVRKWRKTYESKQGDFTKKRELTPEEKEIKSLRKALKDAQEERDILKKAVSIFSVSDK